MVANVRRLIMPLTLLLILVTVVPAAASPNGLMISEFRFRGPAGGNDEFLELVNTSTSAVDISGYRLQGCASSGGNPSDRATVPSGAVLKSGQHYLFTNNGSSGYSGSVAGDQTYSTGFTDLQSGNSSGVRIVDASGGVIDGVGSPTSPCREGTGITTPTTNGDNSFERKVGGRQDTDDNAADFTGPQVGNPQNSGQVTEPPETEVTPIHKIQGPGASSPISSTP